MPPTAEQAYRQVLKLDPANAIAQNNLADLLRQTGTGDSLKEAENLISQGDRQSSELIPRRSTITTLWRECC